MQFSSSKITDKFHEKYQGGNSRGKTTLDTVQEYINEKLDLRKVNILNQRKFTF